MTNKLNIDTRMIRLVLALGLSTRSTHIPCVRDKRTALEGGNGCFL